MVTMRVFFAMMVGYCGAADEFFKAAKLST
jgi:hypothetical protein